MASAIDRTSLRKQTRRSRTSYRELDTDSEIDSDLTTPPPRRKLPTRAARAHHNAASHEDSSVESSSSSDEEIPARRPPTRSQAPVLAELSTRSAGVKRKLAHRPVAPSRRNDFHNFKRRKTFHDAPAKKLIAPMVNIPPLPRSGRIPPWQTLPYHVLLSIMQHAAYPLYIGASTDTGGARWLLNTSELCASFHDACIGALMYNPPTFPAHRAHWLIDLLHASTRHDLAPNPSDITQSNKGKLTLDYRPKVKSLDIEVRQLLVKKSGIDLDDLLKYTPRLKKLRLYHNHDIYSKRYIWALPENARSKGRWSYDKLFDKLDECHIVLDTFEWNGRFLMDDTSLSTLATVSAESASLKQLRSVTFRNLSLPDVAALNEILAENNFVAEDHDSKIPAKPSRLMSWRRNLVKAINTSPELRELSFFDCNVLDDATLLELPSSLQKLEISGCAWVKSEGLQQFLRGKGQHLKTLILEGNQSLSLEFMQDLRTTTPYLQVLEVDLSYHDPTSYKDTEPLFDELLPAGRPSWPEALRTINIGPLRNLKSEDAEGFYQSLVDAAQDLPHLRVLELRTILKDSWRTRAALRQKWAALLDETFSISYNHEVVPASASSSDSERSSRKSSRLSSVPIRQPHNRGHGRCQKVIFDLSDQRPAQDQFTEGDFLDDKPEEDDGEWNGVDVDLPRYSSRKYAW